MQVNITLFSEKKQGVFIRINTVLIKTHLHKVFTLQVTKATTAMMQESSEDKQMYISVTALKPSKNQHN